MIYVKYLHDIGHVFNEEARKIVHLQDADLTYNWFFVRFL